MNLLLNKIITFDRGARFYRFGNADGKRWVVPARNMRVALNLYQPSGRNGKLVKALFPWLHSLLPVRRVIKAETFQCSLQKELNGKLCNIFGVEEADFAIFEGTPSVHQKATMQLSCGKHILGYCKVSDNKEILALFEKETATLQQFAAMGVKGIPQALYCGTLSNGAHIFVQSTVKSTRSKVVHQWGALQDKFIAALHEKTKQTIPFEESDYYKSLTALQEHLHWLPASIDKEVVTTAMAGVMAKYSGKMVEFSACHGDFTPWNMFVEGGELFAFDFEYASLTYPPGIDRCHFELQTAIFEKNMTAEEIASLADITGKEPLVEYLLDIMSRFAVREKGDIKGDVARSFDIWHKLLIKLSTE